MGARAKGKIEAVLFDWDGTLIDSYAADSAAYLGVFREMDIPWGLEELALHYSPNGHHIYRAARLPRSRWKAATRAWRKNYDYKRSKLVTGARRVLAHIARRYKMGLVTSGDRNRVHRQLRNFQLTHLFEVRVCAEDTLRKKPHPAPLRLALRQMDMHPSSCVYVGDSHHDVEMARNVGVRTIAVLGQFPTEKRLREANPEMLLDSLLELPGALERLG